MAVKEDRKETCKCLLCRRLLILGASQGFYHEREFQKVDDITVLVDAVIAFNILSYVSSEFVPSFWNATHSNARTSAHLVPTLRLNVA